MTFYLNKIAALVFFYHSDHQGLLLVQNANKNIKVQLARAFLSECAFHGADLNE